MESKLKSEIRELKKEIKGLKKKNTDLEMEIKDLQLKNSSIELEVCKDHEERLMKVIEKHHDLWSRKVRELEQKTCELEMFKKIYEGDNICYQNEYKNSKVK